MGCSRSVDKRLVLADTLMWTNPDSSLAILNAINRDSLQGDENQAYHALLLTQAQFRCNGNCTGNSLINFALDYYSDNHNREHYTRSLLYKGAYYEFNTQQPVEAMKCYKQAEENADSTDYRNLAQANMRMGMIYYRDYASNGLDTEKFRKSYSYYKILGNKPMMLFSLHHIGNLYRDNKKKEAISLLSQSSYLAEELKDTVSYYEVLSDLSLAYLLDSCFEEAKVTALKCYEMDGRYATNLVHFDAANAYAELNIADSARYYLNRVNIDNCNQYDSMMYARTLSRVFKAEGDVDGALEQENLCNDITQRIIEASKRNDIYETESSEDVRIIREKNVILSNVKWKALFVSLISLLLLIILGYYVYRFKHYKQLVNELKYHLLTTKSLIEEFKYSSTIDNQGMETTEVDDTEENTTEENTKKYNNEKIRTLNHYLSLYYETINDLLQKSNEIPREAFVNEFKKVIVDAAKDNYYWDVTRMLADEKSGGLVTYLCDKNEDLIESEIRIICLMCQGYKNNTIAIITGYSLNSIKSIKTRIKNKIGIPYTLDAFIKQELLKEKHKEDIKKRV